MKKLVLLTVMVLSFAGVAAQEVEFTADRPGASTGPSVVGKGVIQWEQGMQYDGDGAKGASPSATLCSGMVFSMAWSCA